MSQYARIVDNAIADIRDFPNAPDPNQAKGLVWRPFTLTKPSFDPATEVLEGPEDVITSGAAERIFTVRAKTQQEIDADTTAAKDARIAELNGLSGMAKIVNGLKNLIHEQASPPEDPETVDETKAWMKSLL